MTDIGGLNDKGFNTLANVGLKKAKAKLGANLETRVYITNTDADRTPNLQRAAQDGYQLVIANGVLFTFGPLNTVAPAFTSTKFLGTDVDINSVEGKPANVRGVQFREQEAGCLVGNIAALEAKRQPGPDIISAVGANKVTAIVRFFAGYQFCAKRANKSVKVITQYANDPTFDDQAKCKATALSQIARGSRVVFQVAGGCGLGAIDAAKQKKRVGDRRRRRPGLLRPARADERDEARGDLRLRRDHRVPEEPGSLEDRLQRQLHREERRSRVRQALEGAAEEGCGAVQRVQRGAVEVDGKRQGQAAGEVAQEHPRGRVFPPPGFRPKSRTISGGEAGEIGCAV